MKTILIGINNSVIGSLFVHMIAHNTSHFVLLVTNSTEALQITLDIKPDLFLSDYSLQSMNGITLADHLHAQKTFRDIPAIIRSASTVSLEIQQEIKKRQHVYLCDSSPCPDVLLPLESVLHTPGIL